MILIIIYFSIYLHSPMRKLVFLLLLLSHSLFARQVVDITGTSVTVPDRPQRIILGESRMLYTLALLQPGYPAAHIAGWPGDLARYDAQSWQQYVQRFPQMAQIPLLGSGSVRELNPERVLQLQPDLVILPRLAKTGGEEARFRQVMQQAGVPVITVDLRVDLLHNTLPSIKILGEVLNQPQRAQAFSEFYQSHMQRIQQRLANRQGPRTTVMLHLHLGRRDTCCTTAVNGNLGQLIAFAGGDNIAAGTVKGVFGQLNPEQVLAAQPQVYIATGMASVGSTSKTVALGPQVSAQQARQRFQQVMNAQPLIGQLTAVRNGRAGALWHNFYLSPYHVVATEWIAKMLYPQLFADIDPQQTMQQLYQQFLPLDFSGTFWSQQPNE